MLENLLLEAVELARGGRTVEARWLLQEVLRRDRTNETAWLLMADCAETREEGILALESCLRNAPNAARARVGLDILRAEGADERRGGIRRGGLLTDRLNLAVKNVKSQPRRPLEGALHRAPDADGLERLRQELPASWVPLHEDPLRSGAGASTGAGASVGAGASTGAGAPAVEDEPAQAALLPVTARTGPGFTPRPPVDAFLISPDLFTPAEIKEIEESLGPVQLPRRRVSLKGGSPEDWENLGETGQSGKRRIIRRPLRPAGPGREERLARMLLHVVTTAAIIAAAALVLVLAATLLSRL